MNTELKTHLIDADTLTPEQLYQRLSTSFDDLEMKDQESKTYSNH